MIQIISTLGIKSRSHLLLRVIDTRMQNLFSGKDERVRCLTFNLLPMNRKPRDVKRRKKIATNVIHLLERVERIVFWHDVDSWRRVASLSVQYLIFPYFFFRPRSTTLLLPYRPTPRAIMNTRCGTWIHLVLACGGSPTLSSIFENPRSDDMYAPPPRRR